MTSWFQSRTPWPSCCYYDPLHLDSKVAPFGPQVVTMTPYILIPKSHPLALWLLLWPPTSWFQSHTLWPSGCYYDPLHLDSKVTPFGPLVVTMTPYILIPKSHRLTLWLLLWPPTSWFQSHTLWPSGCYYDPLHLDSKVTPFGPLVVTMTPYILISKSHPLALWLLLWSPTSWFQSHTLWPSGCYHNPLHLDSKVTPFGPLVVTMTPYILIPKSHPLALWLLLWPPTSWFQSHTLWPSGCYYDPLHLDSKVIPLGLQNVIITPYILIPKSHHLALRLLLLPYISIPKSHHLAFRMLLLPYILIPKFHHLALRLLLLPYISIPKSHHLAFRMLLLPYILIPKFHHLALRLLLLPYISIPKSHHLAFRMLLLPPTSWFQSRAPWPSGWGSSAECWSASWRP